MIHITEAHELREAVFARLQKPNEYGDYAAQHDVWPCVRKGAGERWLKAQGVTFKPSKSAALYFLRGNSAEALLMGTAEDDKLIVKNGVAVHPDASRDDLFNLADSISGYAPVEAAALTKWLQTHPGVDVGFGEIKSTNFSSFNLYKLAKMGEFGADTKVPMRNYFDQCLNYAVATGTNRCVLIVYTLHGDYADKRSKCPSCGNALGDWIDDFKRECAACGYASKKIDLWAYLVTFDDSDLANCNAEVYIKRPVQFRRAVEAEDKAGVLAAAPGSPNFYCRSCKVGDALGCEYAGKKYD